MTTLQELKNLLTGKVMYKDLQRLSPEARRRVYEAGKDLGDDATYSQWIQYTILMMEDS